MKHLSNLYQRKLIMNLQHFAEDPEGDDLNDQGEEGGEENHQEGKTFTRDDIGKMISAEVAKERIKWEEEAAERVAKARDEGEELARLSEKEREEREKQMREDGLAKREAELTRKELRIEARTQLIEKSIPVELVDILDLSTAENCQKSIVAIEASFSAAIEKAVEERLKLSADNPLGGTSMKKGENNPWSKEHFNLTEQGRITKEDPEKAKLLQQMANK